MFGCSSKDTHPIDIADLNFIEGSLTDFVDPFIGTGSDIHNIGSALPGATAPFGMVKVSPDTSMKGGAVDFYHCSGYYYDDTYIKGFSHVHLHGTGAPDQGNILLMPTLRFDSSKTNEEGYRSQFSHTTEAASPGYYAVTLEDHEIHVELTATEHCAHHRYTFPGGDDSDPPYVIFDLAQTLPGGEVIDAEIDIEPQLNRVSGWLINTGSLSGRYGGYKVYFTAYFNHPFVDYGVWQGGETFQDKAAAGGQDIGAFLGFNHLSGEPLEVKVGVSYVDIAGAENNLDAEIPGWDFDLTREETEKEWEDILSVVRVTGGTQEEQFIFYTALYHSFQMPTLFTDKSGLYMGFDGEVHEADGFRYYSDFSLWDTYRTEHPLLVVLLPEHQRDMVISLVKMYEQGGFIPKWALATGYTNCMIGTSADIVIADTYLKGITDFDAETAYKGVRATAFEPTPPGSAYGGRGGIEYYIDLGYVPADKVGSSTSRTLEFAYADFALSRFADALGKDEDREVLLNRSQNYRNLWEEETKFLRGRNADGTWVEPFLPLGWEDYFVEGNAWHYLWFVPHDIKGLIELFGGREAFIDKLEYFFDKANAELLSKDIVGTLMYYWHGNEPDIHAAYLFAAAGRPDMTQKWVRWIMNNHYHRAPDGLAGNDDCGTLSAWYVFSALGFYPIPGKDLYIIGSPVFEAARVNWGQGELYVIAKKASPENIYVQSARLNNKPLKKPWFRHSDILPDSVIEFEMGPKPSQWGFNEEIP